MRERDRIAGFKEVIERFCVSNPLNRLVRHFSENTGETVAEQFADTERRETILNRYRRVLESKGYSRFSVLTTRYDESAASIALYAGDVAGGLVAKLVPGDHLPSVGYTYPLVLPAYERVRVEGESQTVLDFYPWVDTRNITENDVETMRKLLAAKGLAFNNGDDRIANVGKLRNGSLCVLDIGAVHWVSPEAEKNSKTDIMEWWNKLYSLYPIYESGVLPPQTEQTSFVIPPIQPPVEVIGKGNLGESRQVHGSALMQAIGWLFGNK